MLDSIRRYQQHRIFEMILHNINLHLYLSSLITLIILLFYSFTVAALIFFACLSISLIYNTYFYIKRKDDYNEAAAYLDRKLNGKDMFTTLLEYPNSSENLMLRLLHNRAENMSRKILDQDFDKQDKQILNKILLRLLSVCTGFFLLFLLLNFFNPDLTDKRNKYQKDSIYEKNSLSNRNDKENKTSLIKKSTNRNSGESNSNSGGLQANLQKKDAGEKYNLADSQVIRSGNKVSKSQNKQASNSETDLKEKMSNTSNKASNNQIFDHEHIEKNKDQDQSSKLKDESRKNFDSKPNIKKPETKSFRKTNSRKRDTLKNSEQDRKQNINKSRAKAKLDSRKPGDLGGQKLVQKINFIDQRDIENTLYKKQQDELEQVLNNPRMPKSYKTILKRFYSSEKK